MRGAMGDVAWPIRKIAWKLERRVIWTGADAARSALDSAMWPFRRLRWTVERRVLWPLQDGIPAQGGTGRLALGVSLAAAVAVAGGAALIFGLPGSADDAPAVHRSAHAVQTGAAASTPAPVKAGAPTLQGAPPNFEPAPSPAEAPSDTPGIPANRIADPKPSAIPAAPGGETHAIDTARDFAGAFVLYEVGEGGPKVKRAFSRTATPGLAKALARRPPRLPGSIDVPRARVLNVILGERNKRQVDASVSLLRLGDLSELRLTLIRGRHGWAVSEVRG